ncbi:MAG TPA: N-acetylmuramidase domain-containing protein [Kineosporiaceae bacterium]|nr:N-acetylmuramidase domain-containing protein [Kineosporiaceae bacterium]
MDLQRRAGNGAVTSLVLQPSETSLQRAPRGRRSPAPAQTHAQSLAESVARAVAAGRIADQERPVPPGTFGPPAPGGAFWLLNGLNPADLVQTLRRCSPTVRETLLDRISEADGRFDRPRLESALRSVAWKEDAPGVAGLKLLDAIRTAATGSFAPVWAALAGQNRLAVTAVLRTLDRATLAALQTRLPEAPATDVTMFTQVITDLLGAGTNMQAEDAIDLANLRGLDRTMAKIYNLRGQFIAEQATALGISTHAAAGIMKAESGGATFSASTDKAIIRFENHVFWREWGHSNATTFHQHFRFHTPGQNWLGHEFRVDPAGAWETFHGDQDKEWQAINLAAGLSGQEPAFRSASWGAGQIMGFNSASVGFTSAVDMATAFNASERRQVASIFEFIQAGHLEAAVRADDFLTLARRYNGSGQAAHYAAVISANAAAYQRVTTGKRHVR